MHHCMFLEWPQNTTKSLSNIDNIFHVYLMRGSKLYTPSTLNIQMNLILLWVWAEWAVLGRAKTALKFKFEIEIG